MDTLHKFNPQNGAQNEDPRVLAIQVDVSISPGKSERKQGGKTDNNYWV